MESFYDPDSWKRSTEQKLRVALAVFKKECEEHLDQYMRVTDQLNVPQDVADDYEERHELGIGMLTYHANFVHSKFDGWFKPVATEIGFSVPIADPDSSVDLLRCTNSPQCGQQHSNSTDEYDSLVVYAGRVDMIVEDIRYGGYYIWDHKTAAQLAKDDGFLQLDDQVGSYCWALSVELDLDIKGFIYAESRKDYPKPPKALKRKMAGRGYSVSAQQSTTIEIFKPYVMEHDPEAFKDGAYDDYLDYLGASEATQYHQRFVIVKSQAELANIGRNISLEAADMVDSHLRIYPAVGRFTCSTCAFRNPCLATNMDEDADYQLDNNYTRTTRRYWQDQQASSEKSNK